jgi:predicted phage replisome organizer
MASDNKKYYWLKLKRDFFKRHDIRIIEEMPNGKDYILFYLKLLLESVDHEGALRFSDTIPYNEQMLSVITNTNIDIVRSAMRVFAELNMVEMFDDQTIYMVEVQKLVGSETATAARMRKSRERQKLLECNNVTKCYTEIELEKELKKDKEIEDIASASDESEAPKRKRFVPPTIDEVKAYCRERQNDVDAERFIDYYTSNGWRVGKNKMRDWEAAVRTWERNTGRTIAVKQNASSDLDDIF